MPRNLAQKITGARLPAVHVSVSMMQSALAFIIIRHCSPFLHHLSEFSAVPAAFASVILRT
ncbi:hypothetical protein PILCRDRAFT_823214 [Piloderma croceum F 1598]|uniref:Uncharacterized protein n=1 Tax=Piloderma croceum (strain F 1598) TaxID=765440 RepID=A0A0C3FJN5_PILCF|nr:hypothetical protein PILCRDRAFT_823214 [Piloderma croceum F 1598]